MIMIAIPGYRVKDKIYESANSQIYRATREADNLPVVLKVLRQEYPPPEKIAWFKREYEVTHSLELEGVAKAYSLETDQNRWVMVLEDFGGDSLSQLEVAGKFALAEFLKLAIQVTDILGQIHQQNIMHKDINPSNIIYNPGTGQLKIIDFGISTVLSRETPTFSNPNVLEGTLPYISPEQTGRMNRSMDYRTDFYSLGVTFYELLTGRLPCESNDPMELVHCHTARQPKLPHEIRADIPQVVSDIIMKLMAKDAADRYRSAYGLKADLEECLNQLQAKNMIEPFRLGQRDVSDRFQISQKLYGRESDVKSLLNAFDRVSQGASETMLVTGYAGIGKTVLVQEVYKPITRQRGYFISGKFDQLQRNIPFSSLIQAFRSLMRQILTESEEKIAVWRQELLAALGSSGQVVIDVIPDVELIIGPQPPVPELFPAESQNRFNLVFQKFIRVFTKKEHPLVIFLDDLQWADSASLKLLKLLMTAPDSRFLFFIAAFRDNEVSPTHPLNLTLDEIKSAKAVVDQISLSPLDISHINQFIAESINSTPEKVGPLSQLVKDKTGGNPFFIIEFLKSLYGENLLVFDRQRGDWSFDLERIKTLGITDNVVELMAAKAKKLNPRTQEILKRASCIGSQFDLRTLSVVCEKTLKETAADLWEAVAQELVWPLSGDYKLVELDVEGLSEKLRVEYKFAHDRVKQAMYSLIAETDKKNLHLLVGNLLLKNTPLEKREEKIFDIVNQLNLGRELIAQQGQRDELAKLNLSAGKKAMGSAAYYSAFEYLRAGLGMLAKDSWEIRYELALALHLEAAEASYLSGEFEQMDRLIKVSLEKSKTLLDKIKAYDVLISYEAQHNMLEAVHISIEALRLLGVKLPKRPNRLHILIALLRTKLTLAGKRIESLIDLPEMTDPFKLAIMRILSKGSSAAYFTLPEMVPLVALESAIISTNHGCAAESAFGYAGYGLILSAYLGDIETGYRFGKLALKLLERFGTKARQARTLVVVYSLVQHWKEHADQSIKPLLRAYQLALEAGDLEYAAISAYFHCFFSYYTGRELTDLEKEMRQFEETIALLKQESTLRRQRIYSQVVLNLMGRAKDPTILTGEMHDEEKMLPLYFSTNDKSSIFHLHFNKLVLGFLFGRYRQALENSSILETNLNAVRGQLSSLVFYFYDSLARLAIFADSKELEQKKILKKVKANQKKMNKWAKHAPMNHLHKYCLVEAERFRVMGREVEAIEFYKKAINLARENNYLNEEALANELTARFFMGKGLETAAKAYFQEAHYAYLRWGAKAKVEALEKEFPQWLAKVAEAGRLETTATTATGTRRGEMLDISAVMKTSQTISGEIRLERLLKHLMKIVIENAGAQKGYLILEKEGKWVIEAEGAVDKEEVVALQSVELTEELLPMTIINYVTRSKESVVLDEAIAESQFSQDPYIKVRQSRSILCAPLLHKNELKGIIYLENNLTAGAFTPQRVQMMQMLSSQAALSIENAKAFEEIDELNKNLMQKVEERTKELKMKADQLEISNEELVSASRAKSEFISSMSHELRSPMTAVIGYADLVKAGMLGEISEKTKDAMEKIKKSSNYLLSLVGDILDMSKIEAGKMEIAPHDFLVEDTIKTVLASMKPLADEKNLYLKYEIAQEAKIAYGDLKRVTQILYNIIGNAIKFTEKGGIDVAVKKGEKECIFTIKDTGIGIPEDKRERVFAIFEQVDAKHKGTGLGMSITKQLVELHGGQIWFESEVNKGSTFYFTLPCQQSAGK